MKQIFLLQNFTYFPNELDYYGPSSAELLGPHKKVKIYPRIIAFSINIHKNPRSINNMHLLWGMLFEVHNRGGKNTHAHCNSPIFVILFLINYVYLCVLICDYLPFVVFSLV